MLGDRFYVDEPEGLGCDGAGGSPVTSSAFACPGMMLDAPATPDRVVTFDELGSSRAMRVNVGDIAAVVVDDLDRGALLGQRISVVSS